MIGLNCENKPFFLREIMPLLAESNEIDKYLNFLYECGVTAHKHTSTSSVPKYCTILSARLNICKFRKSLPFPY
jgi:hypothetical protein